ncbi:SWI/SNF-related matrix-associated actin-dependent regulator of chromatin subfamily E member 1-like [Dysidea avara]|uniref:SWI/SNF-related matrix-associated actin-dependent regulator of chromatin subfamily E member 1-like n=1 Tax=Dysidea avara TaxID=196820 RepID=UPI003325EEF3
MQTSHYYSASMSGPAGINKPYWRDGGMVSQAPHGSFQSMTSHWMSGSVSAPSLPHIAGQGTKGKGNSQIPNIPQPPKPPDKPLMPYVRYNKKMWDKLRGDGNSELKLWDISKMIGSKWREMSEEDKQPYFEEYEAEKILYHEQLKIYHNSPSYKRWLEEKRLAEQAYHEAQQMQQQQQQQDNYAPPPPQIITPSHHQAHIDPRLSAVMTITDNEDSEYVTIKQVATARYYRNHKLMAEIFNDSSVPDTRSVVTEERLAMLQTQVQSLVRHQNKLEEELKQIQSKFDDRKRKIIGEQENFNSEMKKLCEQSPVTWKKPVLHISLKDLPTHNDTAVQYTKL